MKTKYDITDFAVAGVLLVPLVFLVLFSYVAYEIVTNRIECRRLAIQAGYPNHKVILVEGKRLCYGKNFTTTFFLKELEL